MASTGSRALDAALYSSREHREEAENLRDLVKRVETLHGRMVEFGDPNAREWADILGKILATRSTVHPHAKG